MSWRLDQDPTRAESLWPLASSFFASVPQKPSQEQTGCVGVGARKALTSQDPGRCPASGIVDRQKAFPSFPFAEMNTVHVPLLSFFPGGVRICQMEVTVVGHGQHFGRLGTLGRVLAAGSLGYFPLPLGDKL